MKRKLFYIITTAILLNIVSMGCKKDKEVTGVTLDETDITLYVGETVTLKTTVHPNDATNKTVRWTSSNSVVAAVTDGIVFAQEAGKSTVTVITEDGNHTATCEVTVIPEEKGVVINGVKWATRNVDMPGTFAATPQDAGMFYQWGRKVGWCTTNPMINSNGGTTWDKSHAMGANWEKANDPCPVGWRVPTWDELKVLTFIYYDNGLPWITINGVNGAVIDCDTALLFLPAVGYRDDNGALWDVGHWCAYWSGTSTGVGGSGAKNFNFCSSGSVSLMQNTSNAFSVRCVAEKPYPLK